MSSGRFAASSAAVFLLPLALAIAGATWARGAPIRELIGGGSGFVLGVLLAAVAVRWMDGRKKT